jgi:hypothetical protein
VHTLFGSSLPPLQDILLSKKKKNHTKEIAETGNKVLFMKRGKKAKDYIVSVGTYVHTMVCTQEKDLEGDIPTNNGDLSLEGRKKSRGNFAFTWRIYSHYYLSADKLFKSIKGNFKHVRHEDKLLSYMGRRKCQWVVRSALQRAVPEIWDSLRAGRILIRNELLKV